MASPHQNTAEAVTNWLNGRAWSQEFTAMRVYRPLATLEQLKTLRVYVIASASVIERTARVGIFQASYTISIGVRKVVVASDVATIDPYDQLHDEIVDALAEQSQTFAESRWMSAQYDPIWNLEDLNDNQLYSSVSNHIFQPEA